MSDSEKEVELQKDEEFDPVENEDTTDWKARAQELEQKAIKQREKTKTLRDQLKEARVGSAPASPKTKTEFDYAEMAYLSSKGVDEQDYGYVFNEVQSTGKSLKDILSFKYLQEELKTLKNGREVQAALPTSKRSGGNAQSEVGYWIAKGEFPPDTPDNKELRKQILQYKVKNSKGSAPQASIII